VIEQRPRPRFGNYQGIGAARPSVRRDDDAALNDLGDPPQDQDRGVTPHPATFTKLAKMSCLVRGILSCPRAKVTFST
jgi:hypothetical protein